MELAHVTIRSLVYGGMAQVGRDHTPPVFGDSCGVVLRHVPNYRHTLTMHLGNIVVWLARVCVGLG